MWIILLQPQHLALFIKNIRQQLEAVAHWAAIATAEVQHSIEILRKRLAGRQTEIALQRAIDLVQGRSKLAPILERDNTQKDRAQLLHQFDQIIAADHCGSSNS